MFPVIQPWTKVSSFVFQFAAFEMELCLSNPSSSPQGHLQGEEGGCGLQMTSSPAGSLSLLRPRPSEGPRR